MSTVEQAHPAWRKEAAALLALGGPAIAAQLAQMSMGLVDTIMAGQLGPEALAAISIGSGVWMPVFVFGLGILLAVTPTVAHSRGAGESALAGGHLRQGLWLGLAVSAGAFVFLQSAEPLLGRFKVDSRIVPVAGGYLRALSWGVPGAFAFIVMRAFSEAVSMTRPVMLVSFLALLANMVGNYVFMYGHLGMPRLGAVGTGVATACVWWLKALAMAAFITCQPEYRPYQPFARIELARLARLGALLRLGIPIAVSLFMEGSCFAVASLLIGRLGVEAVAGHQIALNFASYMFMVPLGVSIAISVRVGQACGARDLPAARRTAMTGAHLCALFMAGAATAMFLAPELIVSCYTRDASVRLVAARLLGVAALFQIFDGLQVAGAGALRGLKDTKVPMLITTMAYWAVGLPLGAWLGLGTGLGAAGFWYGFCAGLAFAAAALNWRFHKEILRRIEGEAAATPLAVELPHAMPAAEPSTVPTALSQ